MARNAVCSRVGRSEAATMLPWEITMADTFSYFRYTHKKNQIQNFNILVALSVGRLSLTLQIQSIQASWSKTFLMNPIKF